jgi:hypothetical protein
MDFPEDQVKERNEQIEQRIEEERVGLKEMPTIGKLQLQGLWDQRYYIGPVMKLVARGHGPVLVEQGMSLHLLESGL